MRSLRSATSLVVTSIVLLFGNALVAAYSGVFPVADDDASAEFIAAQISLNSGGDPASYEGYSRRLARTLSLLTPAQQMRVFQPAPGAPSDPETADLAPPQMSTAESAFGSTPKPADLTAGSSETSLKRLYQNGHQNRLPGLLV